MAAKRKNSKAPKRNKPKARAHKSRPRVTKIVEQVKEPLSLLETLKEEGVARAMYLLGAANVAAQGIKKEKVRARVKEGVQALGIMTRAEFEALEDRVRELEDRLAQIVPHRDHDEEE